MPEKRQTDIEHIAPSSSKENNYKLILKPEWHNIGKLYLLL